MAQDIGSALLGGIQGAMAMGQQRFKNRIAEDELAIAQSTLEINKQANERSNRKDARDAIGIEADRVDGEVRRLGYLNPDGTLNTEKLFSDMKAGSPDAWGFGSSVLNVNKDVERYNRGDFSPRDFAYTGIDEKLFKEKGLVLPIGQYKDGRTGVFTREGGDKNDETVLPLSLEDAVANIATAYQLRVNPYSNGGATNAQSRRLVATGVGKQLGAAADAREPSDNPDSPALRVLQTIDEQLPVEASRTFMGQLSSIQDPQEQNEFIMAVAEGLGVEIPKTSTEGGFSSTKLGVDREETLSSGADAWGVTAVVKSSDTVRGIDTQISQKRERANRMPVGSNARGKLEIEITELNTKRANFIREENEKTWSGFEDQIRKADEAIAAPNVTTESRSYWESRKKDAEDKKSAFIKAGGRTPATQTVDYEALQNNIVSKLSNMSAAQIKDAIDQGVIDFSDADMQALRARMTEVGVRPNDSAQVVTRKLAKGLPRDEMIAAFAAMYAQTDNAGFQQAILQMMSNVIDTGSPSLSDAALRGLILENRRTTVDEQNSQRQLAEATIRARTTSQTGNRKDFESAMDAARRGFNTIFANKDEDDNPRAPNIGDVTLWANAELPMLQANVEYLARSGNVAQANQLYGLVNGQIAAAVAVLADQMPQGFFKDLWHAWTGTRATKDTMAKQLQNIRVITGQDKRVKSIILINRGTGQQVGKELTAQSVQNIDGGPELFNILATHGVINEELRQRAAQGDQSQSGGR